MISLSSVTRYFGKLKALDNIDMTIEEGDIYGFIGPNGAGKSTTLKILAGILQPSSGSITINGYDVTKDRREVVKIVGYMPDVYGMYEDMTVEEYLRFFCHANFIGKKKVGGIVDEVLELTDLTIKRDSKIEELSRGMRQRVCLSRALLHDPKILLLDEPASGLDPKLRIEFRELIKALSEMGKTIFISSHILTELSPICNKVGIIEKGKLLASGLVEDIKNNLKPKKMVNVRLLEKSADVYQLLDLHETVTDIMVEDHLIRFGYSGNDTELHGILADMINGGVKVVSLFEDKIDLEDIFMEITKGEVS